MGLSPQYRFKKACVTAALSPLLYWMRTLETSKLRNFKFGDSLEILNKKSKEALNVQTFERWKLRNLELENPEALKMGDPRLLKFQHSGFGTLKS